jgi:hypothetical protein
MNSAPSLFRHKPAAQILAALALAFFSLLAAPRPAHAQSSVPLNKHARRIEKRLTKFRQGTFLDFEFRDSSQTFGSLGPLSASSFQFTDADSNRTQTHLYAEVSEVKKAKEYIGEGSEPRHHVRLLVPVLIGAGAAAAGIATYEAVR